MTIVLSHISALEYWRSVRQVFRPHTVVSRAKSLVMVAPRLDFEAPCEPILLKRPLNVLVGDATLRRSTKDIACHVWSGPLRKGYVVDTGKVFYVVSPEFCFMQMAELMTPIELAELGYEMCGTYDSSGDTVERCVPLTSVARLESFAAGFESSRRSEKAARVLPYVIDNSASPMETVLAIFLCAPYRLGGYGLPKPLMNHRIDVRGDTLGPGGYYSCDLFWPDARLAVEYDSDRFHAGKEKLTRDSVRRGDLASVGVTVLSVTRQQLFSRHDTDRLARTFAERIGKRVRCKEPTFSEAVDNLRRTLLGTRRF